MKTEAVKVRVKGRVQGVGYRRFAQKRAEECQIFGWARNVRAGDVEVFAEGDSENLKKFIEHLRAGPSFGKVEKLDSAPAKVENKTDFLILPDGV